MSNPGYVVERKSVHPHLGDRVKLVRARIPNKKAGGLIYGYVVYHGGSWECWFLDRPDMGRRKVPIGTQVLKDGLPAVFELSDDAGAHVWAEVIRRRQAEPPAAI